MKKITFIIFLTIFFYSSSMSLSLAQSKKLNCQGEALKSSGIKTELCYPGDDKLLSTTCPGIGDAYAFLKSRLCGKPASHATGLSPDFACKLAQFIKAGDDAGRNIRILSGYRSPEHQKALFLRKLKQTGGNVSAARKVVAPPPGMYGSKGSWHNYGCAADLRLSCSRIPPKNGWEHKNARNFGLYFRMSWEPWHIEPLDKSLCGKSGGIIAKNTDNSAQGRALDLKNTPHEFATNNDTPYTTFTPGAYPASQEGYFQTGNNPGYNLNYSNDFTRLYDDSSYIYEQEDLDFSIDGADEIEADEIFADNFEAYDEISVSKIDTEQLLQEYRAYLDQNLTENYTEQVPVVTQQEYQDTLSDAQSKYINLRVNTDEILKQLVDPEINNSENLENIAHNTKRSVSVFTLFHNSNFFDQSVYFNPSKSRTIIPLNTKNNNNVAKEGADSSIHNASAQPDGLFDKKDMFDFSLASFIPGLGFISW